MVQVGDRVLCVDSEDVDQLLTVGQTYEVVEVDDNYIRVIDNRRKVGGYFYDRFQLFVEGSTFQGKVTFSQRGAKLYNEASNVINGERQTSYGNPEDSFEWIAQRWNQYLKGRFNADFELTADDTTFMMADFKMARECNQHKKDNLIDATGYLGINYDIKESKDA